MSRLSSALYRITCGPSTDTYWKHREKALRSGGLALVYHRIKCIRVLRSFNAYIPLSADFTGKPNFPHEINGVFVSKGAKIGKNCTIFQQVTIGSVTSEGSSNIGSPTIGDNVIIGAGAKIIGNVKIGDNVRIGANCVVVKDIPDNSTVVLPSSRVITHDVPRNNDFVAFTND